MVVDLLVVVMVYSFTVLVGGARGAEDDTAFFEQPYFRLVSSHTPINKTTKRVDAIDCAAVVV